MTKELVGRSLEQESPEQRASQAARSTNRKLRSSIKEPVEQTRSSKVAGRVRQSEVLSMKTTKEAGPQRIAYPTSNGGPVAPGHGSLRKLTVSNVRSNVPTEKVNGVHDTQSTNKISAAEQKLTQSS